jgi:hypothetical protein
VDIESQYGLHFKDMQSYVGVGVGVAVAVGVGVGVGVGKWSLVQARLTDINY